MSISATGENPTEYEYNEVEHLALRREKEEPSFEESQEIRNRNLGD